MVQQQVASQIRVRDFTKAEVSISPAEHGSWEAAREALVSERMVSVQRDHSAAIAAAASDELVAELTEKFKDQQSAIEAAVDEEKHEIHLELQADYNFLSSGNGRA